MKVTLNIAVWFMAFVIGGALFWTSNRVQIEETVSTDLQRHLSGYEERVSLLQAEWNLLNNPAYLDKLVLALKDGDVSKGTIVLADASALPNYKRFVMPVQKPVQVAVQERPVESIVVPERPVLVAQAKTVHSEERISPSESQEFAFVLASWAQ